MKHSSLITAEDIAERDAYCDRANFPKNKDFITACSEDVILFMTHMLGMRPYVWQFKVLQTYMSGNRRIIINTSRQIGKSTLIAVLATWRILFNKGWQNNPDFKNRRQNTADCIVSRGDEQAKKLLGEVKSLFREGDSYLKNLNEKIFGTSYFSIMLDNKNNDVSTVTLKPKVGGTLSGSFVKSHPPTDVILGNTYTGMFFDEASRIDDYIFYEVAMPAVKALGDTVVIASTPDKPKGFFYDICDPNDQNPSNDWDRFEFPVTCLELDDPSYYKILIDEIKSQIALGKVNEVNRNYYCSFASSDETYFPIDIVKNCMDNSLEKLSTYRKTPVTIGIDVGGANKSHTVITITTIPDERNVSKRINCYRYPLRQDGDIVADLEFNIVPNYSVSAIIVDDCLDKDTEIIMADFSRKKICDVKVGDLVQSYDFVKKQYVIKPVLNVWNKGVLKTNKVTFMNGYSVYATDNHKWFSINNNYTFDTARPIIRRTTELLGKNEFIPLASGAGVDSNYEPITETEAYVLGMYIAEGHRRPTRRAVFISQTKYENKLKLFKIMEKTSWIWQRNKKGVYVSEAGDFMLSLFESCGHSSYTKQIPEIVFSFSKRLLLSFRQGLYDGDGVWRKDSGRFEYFTVSEKLAKDVAYLNLLLGTPARISSRVRSGFGSKLLQYTVDANFNSPKNKGKVKVKSIIPDVERCVYDIEVADTQAFVLAESGVITHNCPASQILMQNLRSKGWNIIPFQFNKNTKPDYMNRFRSRLAERKSVTYADSLLFDEFASYSMDMKPLGNATDDCIDSWMLSQVPFMDNRQKFKAYVFGSDPLVPEDELREEMGRAKDFMGLSRSI